ncbi:M28 family peptidase [Natrialba swarupiae]|nr:M28 family peptidase [Natrialba swarupiae]
MARLLATATRDLETRVRFVTFGAEELHLLGSEAWAAETDPETVRAVINLDGLVRRATQSSRPTVSTPSVPRSRRQATIWASRSNSTMAQFRGDQWPFVYRGIPGAMVTAKTTGTRCEGGATPTPIRSTRSIGGISGRSRCPPPPPLPSCSQPRTSTDDRPKRSARRRSRRATPKGCG